MTGVGQNQLGADISRAVFLSPREKIRVGCWKLAQVIKKMNRYRMDITVIIEARWTGSGMMKERSGHMVIL